MKLTVKQKRFADEYIISGNATDAAKKAGYSEKTAGVIGSENLIKPNISSYIKKRMDEIESKKIMTLEEALALTSTIARREIQKGYSKQVDKLSGEVIKDVEYTFTPSVEEAQKSLEHIIRCNGGFMDKLQADVDMELSLEVNYEDD